MIDVEYKPCIRDMDYPFPPPLADFLGPNHEVHIIRMEVEGSRPC